MTPAALQRQVVLAGAALLAVLLVVVLDRPAGKTTAPAPPPLVTGTHWETAVVGVFGRARVGKTTACGITLTAETRGVAHPVLPCGVKLIVSSGRHEIRTEVIERGPSDSATEFDLSPALAGDLGVGAKSSIRWRFAG